MYVILILILQLFFSFTGHILFNCLNPYHLLSFLSFIPISITFFTCTPKSKKNVSIGLGGWIDNKNLRDILYILRQDYKCSRYHTFIKHTSVFIEQVYHVLTIYVRWFQQIVTVAFYSTVDPLMSPSGVRSSIIGFLFDLQTKCIFSTLLNFKTCSGSALVDMSGVYIISKGIEVCLDRTDFFSICQD